MAVAEAPRQRRRGYRFITGLRLAYTEVRVDKEHFTDAGMLVGLSAVVAKTVPEGIASY